MKRILTALTLSAVLASPAWSGFTNNKSEWDKLLSSHQIGYVMGVVDEMITPFVGETRSDKQFKLRTHNSSTQRVYIFITMHVVLPVAYNFPVSASTISAVATPVERPT